MKFLIIFLVFPFLSEGTKSIFYHYTLISTPFKEQTISYDSNYNLIINYQQGQNVLIIFESYKSVYLFDDNIHIYHNSGKKNSTLKYIIQRDGINCALFIFDISKEMTSSQFVFKSIENNFEFKFTIKPRKIFKEEDETDTDFVMLAGNSFNYFGERKYLEIICYSEKSLKKKGNLSISVVEKSNVDINDDYTMTLKNYDNVHDISMNFVSITIKHVELMHRNVEHAYVCGKDEENDEAEKETIKTVYFFIDNNRLDNESSIFSIGDQIIIILSSLFLLFLIFIRFIIPICKLIIERSKKREQQVCEEVTKFFLKSDITKYSKTSFDNYIKTQRPRCNDQCLITEADLHISYVLIKSPTEKSCIYLINNLTLDASVSFWKFAFSKNIELIVTLAPCLNYTNAEDGNDHFYEYAPGYFPEFISDMIISMEEKQATELKGIYLKDFEISKLNFNGENNSTTKSILQLYVANWNLKNNIPSPFYISHILSIIESLECETLLIHGTRLGRRADILTSIILLNKKIMQEIKNKQKLDNRIIEDTMLFFESITQSKKFDEFEYNIIITSFIAHLVRQGYIQDRKLEKHLKEQFNTLIMKNTPSNM